MADSTGGNNSGDDPVDNQNLDANVVLVGQLKAAYKEVTAEVERKIIGNDKWSKK